MIKWISLKKIFIIIALVGALQLSIAGASLTSPPHELDEPYNPLCGNCKENASLDLNRSENSMVTDAAIMSSTLSEPPWMNGSLEISFDMPPGIAILERPSGILTNNKPTYVWNKVSDALFYCLHVNTTRGNPIIRQWYSAADFDSALCSVTPLNTLAAGDYSWRIQTWNSTGRSWSNAMDFTICLSSSFPGKATLISPKGTVGTARPTYKWNAVPGSTEYRIKVINVNNPNYPVIDQWNDSAEVLSGSVCEIKPDVDLAPGTYKFWIQTRNCKGDGPLSNYIAFKYVSALPAMSNSIYPRGLISSSYPIFKWSKVQSATEYNIQVDVQDGENTVTIVDEWFDATDVTFGRWCQTSLPAYFDDGVYYWRVRAANDAGNGAWSSDRYFEVLCGGDMSKVKSKKQKADSPARKGLVKPRLHAIQQGCSSCKA